LFGLRWFWYIILCISRPSLLLSVIGAFAYAVDSFEFSMDGLVMVMPTPFYSSII